MTQIRKSETAQFGSEANNTFIEEDGSVKWNGDATTWDDIVGSLIGRRLSSTAGRLDYDYNENSIKMQNNGNIGNENDRLMFSYQYPHAAKEDGEMRLHIHWEQTNNVDKEFTLQYRIQSNGSAKTTAWQTVVISTAANNIFTYISGTLNQITELEQIDMTGAGISSTVQFRLARTDSESGDVHATFVDAHIERDRIGSRQEYVR